MRKLTSFLIAAGGVMAACGDDVDMDTPKTATATFMGVGGQTVTGTARFTEGRDGKVTVVVTITAAPPGVRGIHIHDVPSCDDEGMAAGPHWDDDDTSPENHGLPEGDVHLGDLGNIEIAADGTGTLTYSNPAWTLGDGRSTDVVPHAIILHASMDDGTMPSAGARWGCALIVAD
jgi:superoxide dismutase, Cu-Zn family